MRFSRFRFTTRQMMACVAVVGLVTSLEANRRRSQYVSLAESHHSMEHPAICGLTLDLLRDETSEFSQLWKRQRDYHARMADKYERAARYPLLPVVPDPPEPL